MPKPTSGMRHIALFTRNLEACTEFYTKLIGMKLEWQPDPDNVYLTSGNDSLALHRAPQGFEPNSHQRLDHLGFMIDEPEQVDEWCTFLKNNGVSIKAEPRQHRDGSRSFYFADPDGNTVQFIHYPPVLNK